MRRKAFTLIELLIVVGVFAAILGAAIPFCQGKRPDSPATRMEQLEQRVLLLEVKVAKLEGVEK